MMVSNHSAPNDVVNPHSSCIPGNEWRDLNPLNTSDVSISIHQAFDALLCGSSTHVNNCCHYPSLQRLYGPCLFKCPYLGCKFRRQGFETRKLQRSHTKHHDRPWKCKVPGCEYAEMGFLSKPMRDAHLDQFHTEDQQRQSVQMPDTQTLDKDEIQALFFDLVRADRTTEVKQLLGHFEAMLPALQRQLLRMVSETGSGAMMDVLYNVWVTSTAKVTGDYGGPFLILNSAIRSKNLEVVQWILKNVGPTSPDGRKYWTWADIVEPVLESDSEELFQCFLPEFVQEFTTPRRGERTSPAGRAMSRAIVRATARQPDRERRLILLWDKVREGGEGGVKLNLGRCLKHVAETCHSIPLAKTLLCYGASINSTGIGTGTYRTPLECALRKSSPEAAEMARFLLYRGADPEQTSTRSKLESLRDEIGAKRISKWLGMSWDELVAKVYADREAGICPDEFR